MKNYLTFTKVLTIMFVFAFVIFGAVNAQEVNTEEAANEAEPVVEEQPADPELVADEQAEVADEKEENENSETEVSEGDEADDKEEGDKKGRDLETNEPEPKIQMMSFDEPNDDISVPEEEPVLLEASSASSLKPLGYCHVPQDKGNNPNDIYTYHEGSDLNGWEGHDGHTGDYLVYDQDDIDNCSTPNQDPKPIPTSDNAALKICKIIVDNNGQIVNGEGLETQFSIEITKPDQSIEIVTFETPLTLTDDIVDDNDGNDAECYTIDQLSAGQYLYDAEDISGQGTWLEAKYNDYFKVIPTSLSDFFTLTVDGQPGDNDDADGVMNLSKDKARNLVIVNTLKERDPRQPENICLLPDTGSDSDDDDVSKNGEIDIQELLDDNYSGLDEVDDQLQIQKWSCDSDNLELDVKFIGKWADHGKIFGYYTDSNISSFEPVFRAGNTDGSYASTTEANEDDSFSINIADASTKDIGFAIKSWTSFQYKTYATENSLNQSNSDKVVAYNPEPDTYFLGFEDIGGPVHTDFNDLVVEVKAYCEDDEEPEYPYGFITYPSENDPYSIESGTTTLMAEYYDNNPDEDPVLWAVRKDSCDAGVNTVLGNVDYKTDSADWDGQDFSFEFNADDLEPGNYCFIFNPTDNGPGSTDVRDTRWFTVEDGEEPPTYQCSDGLDNDDDGFIDYDGGDPGCDSAEDDNEDDENGGGGDLVLGCTDPQANNYNSEATEDDNSCDYGSNGGGGDDDGGSISGGGISGGRRSATVGEVLGATTDIPGTCGIYLNTYMRQDLTNDPWEVKKLQAFLTIKGYSVPVTGMFGPQTDQAVRNFQADLNEQILIPWAQYNMSDGKTPTGYVYKTTRYTINNIVCPGSEVFPQLP